MVYYYGNRMPYFHRGKNGQNQFGFQQPDYAYGGQAFYQQGFNQQGFNQTGFAHHGNPGPFFPQQGGVGGVGPQFANPKNVKTKGQKAKSWSKSKAARANQKKQGGGVEAQKKAGQPVLNAAKDKNAEGQKKDSQNVVKTAPTDQQQQKPTSSTAVTNTTTNQQLKNEITSKKKLIKLKERQLQKKIQQIQHTQLGKNAPRPKFVELTKWQKKKLRRAALLHFNNKNMPTANPSKNVKNINTAPSNNNPPQTSKKKKRSVNQKAKSFSKKKEADHLKKVDREKAQQSAEKGLTPEITESTEMPEVLEIIDEEPEVIEVVDNNGPTKVETSIITENNASKQTVQQISNISPGNLPQSKKKKKKSKKQQANSFSINKEAALVKKVPQESIQQGPKQENLQSTEKEMKNFHYLDIDVSKTNAYFFNFDVKETKSETAEASSEIKVKPEPSNDKSKLTQKPIKSKQQGPVEKKPLISSPNTAVNKEKMKQRPIVEKSPHIPSTTAAVNKTNKEKMKQKQMAEKSPHIPSTTAAVNKVNREKRKHRSMAQKAKSWSKSKEAAAAREKAETEMQLQLQQQQESGTNEMPKNLTESELLEMEIANKAKRIELMRQELELKRLAMELDQQNAQLEKEHQMIDNLGGPNPSSSMFWVSDGPSSSTQLVQTSNIPPSRYDSQESYKLYQQETMTISRKTVVERPRSPSRNVDLYDPFESLNDDFSSKKRSASDYSPERRRGRNENTSKRGRDYDYSPERRRHHIYSPERRRHSPKRRRHRSTSSESRRRRRYGDDSREQTHDYSKLRLSNEYERQQLLEERKRLNEEREMYEEELRELQKVKQETESLRVGNRRVGCDYDFRN